MREGQFINLLRRKLNLLVCRLAEARLRFEKEQERSEMWLQSILILLLEMKVSQMSKLSQIRSNYLSQ